MMPRHYAAENLALTQKLLCLRYASMMTRHYAAELRRAKPGIDPKTLLWEIRFKVAAAFPRGKRPDRGRHASVAGASMMPRHYAAENAGAIGVITDLPLLQ